MCTYTHVDTLMRAHNHVHTDCLRAHANAPAISGSLIGGSHTSTISFGLPPIRIRTKNEHTEDRDETIFRLE